MTIRKTAIITGATSGIGTRFAKTLASQGWDLIITGRRVERLTSLSNEMTRQHHINVQSVVADFSKKDELAHFLDIIDHNTNIELLINNAGFGSIGNYFENDYSKQQEMLNVHITATTKIIYRTVPIMIQNGKGSIINVASLSAFYPGPHSYFYCSTKAFLVTFSECLHIDLSHKNIKIQVLCPGFTNTEFHSRQGISHSDSYIKRRLFWKSPQQVVDKSLRSLGRKKIICIPGYFNRLLLHISKIIPRTWYYRIAEKNADIFLKRIEKPSPQNSPTTTSIPEVCTVKQKVRGM
ncbi:SDR family NAD(P)-dependent oxidoreductase [Saccharicrinis fermentans]|uniref:Serine 3-dehydrogenase n=1 Tax=Saccharicrinis fermentans DSM 9555 = JCM 21142 TaxID=869213 RepID=W7YES5_9BACT|nr:SDR family oxidoreductase [Saccharicrinis fermentans]GAF05973.1 serine 3-dehydrogenase [Saccharicrinis fermentans DSM 9555 = JCM 21142]